MYILSADPKPGDPDFWEFQQNKLPKKVTKKIPKNKVK
jgi:hypothetical protein